MELIQQYSFDMLYDSVTLKVELHGHEADRSTLTGHPLMSQNRWLAECQDSRGSFQRAALFILEFYSQKHEMSHPNLVISKWYLELTSFIVWQSNQKHF